MSLSPEQDRAMQRISRWMEGEGEWMFFLSGYAGTGKTYLLHHLINGLKAPPLCLAPTGKAASVLQKKLTGATVSTIHSALYKAVQPSTLKLAQLEAQLLQNPGTRELEKAIQEERVALAKKRMSFADKIDVGIAPGQLVIVDEASMVTTRMVMDLQRTGARVLFVGDSGQLPPVGDSGFFAKRKPDATLETVQRQALESPIIRLSMAIRNKDPIPHRIKDPGGLERMAARDFAPQRYKEADQILTGTNRSRMALNRSMRRMLKFTKPFPEKGERLICLKNDRKDGKFFTNGVQCECAADAEFDENLGDWSIGLLYEGVKMDGVNLYPYPFEAYTNPKAVEWPFHEREGLVELDYGYAITVHKSQGSEWDRVVLYDDAFNADDINFRRKWTYTAVTRAKSSLVWLVK